MCVCWGVGVRERVPGEDEGLARLSTLLSPLFFPFVFYFFIYSTTTLTRNVISLSSFPLSSSYITLFFAFFFFIVSEFGKTSNTLKVSGSLQLGGPSYLQNELGLAIH